MSNGTVRNSVVRIANMVSPSKIFWPIIYLVSVVVGRDIFSLLGFSMERRANGAMNCKSHFDHPINARIKLEVAVGVWGQREDFPAVHTTLLDSHPG